MIAEYVLVLMLSISLGADFERYAVIAQAIAEVSGGQPDLARALIALAKEESDMRREVHNGSVRGDRGRSCSLWQIHLPRGKRTTRGWRCKDLVGVNIEATRRAAAAAGDIIIHFRERCKGDMRCVFANYVGCKRHDKRAIDRMQTYERLSR